MSGPHDEIESLAPESAVSDHPQDTEVGVLPKDGGPLIGCAPDSVRAGERQDLWYLEWRSMTIGTPRWQWAWDRELHTLRWCLEKIKSVPSFTRATCLFRLVHRDQRTIVMVQP